MRSAPHRRTLLRCAPHHTATHRLSHHNGLKDDTLSSPVAKRTTYDDAVDAELVRWPGVTATREVRGKHYALVLVFAGRSRFVIYPGSPSDAMRGLQNHLTDVRQTLRDLGAERVSLSKRQSRRRRRNRTEPLRLVITDRATGGPKRDPWAPLQALKRAEPHTVNADRILEGLRDAVAGRGTYRTVHVEPAPPAKVSWWRAMLRRIFG